MANVVIYDPNDSIVINRVTQYLLSVNTPDYENLPNVLINPDVSGLTIDKKYWKVVSDTVVEMTQNEKTATDELLKAKWFRDKIYKVSCYQAQKATTDSYYDIDNEDGTYSGLAEKTTYTYQGSKLLYKIVTTYFYDGTQAKSIKFTYYQNSNGDLDLIEKQVEV